MKKLNIEELVQVVHDLGYNVKNHMDLMKIGPKDKGVIPVMLPFLEKTDLENENEFIVRCLSVKGFSEVSRTFLNEFKKETSSEHLRWVIGHAFYLIMDKRIVNELRELIAQSKYGNSRGRIVRILGKFKDSKTLPLLIALLGDQDDYIKISAIKALSFFKDESLPKYIEPFLDDEDCFVRREAVKAIKKWKRLGVISFQRIMN